MSSPPVGIDHNGMRAFVVDAVVDEPRWSRRPQFAEGIFTLSDRLGLLRSLAPTRIAVPLWLWCP